MTDRVSNGDSEPTLLHFDQSPLEKPLPPVGAIDRTVQEEIDAMLRFLRRTGYPAVAAPQLGFRRRILAVDLAGGVLGRILQHKLEHLDGRLFLQRVDAPDRLALLAGGPRREPSCRLPPRRERATRGA